MEQLAIQEALLRLEKAYQAVDQLPQCLHFADYRQAWFDFLGAVQVVHNKLSSGSRGSAKSRAWMTKKRSDQKTDPLLRWLKQARNSEEHSLGSSLRYQEGSITYLPKGPGASISFTQHMEGSHFRHQWSQLEITENKNVEVICIPATAHLQQVKDDRFGDVFDPPTEHLGKPIEDLTPPAVAKLALDYYHDLIGEAQGLVPGFSSF